MAIIQSTTRFGTTSLFNNGQLVGLSSPSAYGMGSITHAPFQSTPSEKTVDHQSGMTSHYDGNGRYTGSSFKDQLGNKHFTDTSGDRVDIHAGQFGVDMTGPGGVFKRIIGDSDDAMELATKYASGAIDHGQDLIDTVY